MEAKVTTESKLRFPRGGEVRPPANDGARASRIKRCVLLKTPADSERHKISVAEKATEVRNRRVDNVRNY